MNKDTIQVGDIVEVMYSVKILYIPCIYLVQQAIVSN